MTAFHFPPCHGSSGIQRTLKFVRYLPGHGWNPLVLAAHPSAYEHRSDELLREIPPQAVVARARALDAGRHLAIRGRYFGFTAMPDRWVSWLPMAVIAGRRLVRQHRPAVLWSTYPIPTSLMIGERLQAATQLPWIVDLRDAMVDEDFPAPGARREQYERLEARVVARATRVVLTTESARLLYEERYPGLPREHWNVIRNGFDDENFAHVSAGMQATDDGGTDRPLTLLHSGLLEPNERDPKPFIAAVARLKQRGVLRAPQVRIVLRASGHEGLYAKYASDAGVADLVHLEPAVGHYEALREMLGANGLLLFQGANCNHLVPAKLYEYFRSQRPILALTDERGESAKLMRDEGMHSIVSMTEAEDIEHALEDFLRSVRMRTARTCDPNGWQRYSRRAQAGQLAALLDEIA